jgi:hypothetical protein
VVRDSQHADFAAYHASAMEASALSALSDGNAQSPGTKRSVETVADATAGAVKGKG